MKKAILTMVLILTNVILFAQGKTITIEEQQITYCEIVGTFYNKARIEIDFGQSKEFYSNDRYKDPNTGKPTVFTSMIDALNFMSKNGWEFVQAYTIGNDQHFLLKRVTKLIDNESTNQP